MAWDALSSLLTHHTRMQPTQSPPDEQDLSSPSDSQFVICRGLRYAAPYEQWSVATFFKPRYTGQSLAQALGSMFRRQRGEQDLGEATAYWAKEIKNHDRIRIRPAKQSPTDAWTWQTAKDPDWKVTKGASVRIRNHVHEKVVAVNEGGIQILVETPRFLAINKPGGVATVDEVTGGGTNSLVTLLEEVLAHQAGDSRQKLSRSKLTPAHRLDKPVSGVLWWGQTASQAARLLELISQKSSRDDSGCRKIYIARCQPSSCGDMAIDLPEKVRIEPSLEDVQDTSGRYPKMLPSDRCVKVTAELRWNHSVRRSVPCTTDECATRLAHRAAVQRGQAQKRAHKEAKRREWEGKSDTAGDNTAGSIDGDKIMNSTASENAVRYLSTTMPHTTKLRRLGPPLPDGSILVACQPVTGARHQIRAHLALLGWPIVNDTVYGGVRGSEEQQLAYVDDEYGTLRSFLGRPDRIRNWCPTCHWVQQMLCHAVAEKDFRENGTVNEKVRSLYQPIVLEPSIWLHSYRYIIPAADLDATAPLPPWAEDVTPYITDNPFLE